MRPPRPPPRRGALPRVGDARAWVRLLLALPAAPLRLGARLRLRRWARLIRRSGLFDARHYLAQCGDDPEARKDPLAHYLANGAGDPNPLLRVGPWSAPPAGAGTIGTAAFVRLVRSRRALPKAPPLRPVLPSEPLPGETLLAQRPFRGPGAEGGPRRALVVGRGEAAQAGEDRRSAMVEALRAEGWAVAVVGDAAGALAYVAAEGARCDLALLGDPGPSFDVLPALRAFAPQAVVAIDPAHLRAAGGAPQGAASPGADARAELLDAVNAACADVVLAASAEERQALAARIPGARVALVPDPRAATSAGGLGAALLAAATAGEGRA